MRDISEVWSDLGLSAHPEAPKPLQMFGALFRGEMTLYRELASQVGGVNPKADWGEWVARRLGGREAAIWEAAWKELHPTTRVLSMAFWRQDDAAFVDRVLGLGVPIESDIGGGSMMSVALARRHALGYGMAAVERLVEAGARCVSSDPEAESAAWVACWEGRPDLLQKMLDRGLDPNWRPPLGASESGSLLRLCLEKERSIGQAERSACARALLAAGASARSVIEAGSLSLLEEMLRGPQRGWFVSWSYFSETGLSPKDALPTTREGFEALDRAWRESLELGEGEDYPESLTKGSQGSGSPTGWLGVCFEAMRLELALAPAVARTTKSL